MIKGNFLTLQVPVHLNKWVVPKGHQYFPFHVKSTFLFILKQQIGAEKMKYMVRRNGKGKQKRLRTFF